MKCHLRIYWTPEKGCIHYKPKTMQKSNIQINKEKFLSGETYTTNGPGAYQYNKSENAIHRVDRPYPVHECTVETVGPDAVLCYKSVAGTYASFAIEFSDMKFKTNANIPQRKI